MAIGATGASNYATIIIHLVAIVEKEIRVSVQLLKLRLRRAVVDNGEILSLLSTFLHRVLTLFHELLMLLMRLLKDTLARIMTRLPFRDGRLAAVRR